MENRAHVARMLPHQLESVRRPKLSSSTHNLKVVYSSLAKSSPVRNAAASLQSSSAFPNSSHSALVHDISNQKKNLVYDSPRISLPDSQIFPSSLKIRQRWQRPDDRWHSLGEHAGEHKQDGSILKISKRVYNPICLQFGMPASALARVQEIHLPFGRKQENALPLWLETMATLFKNLKHLYLVDFNRVSGGPNKRFLNYSERIAVMNDGSSDVGESDADTSLDNDSDSSSDSSVTDEASEEYKSSENYKESRVLRLYILYRLPKLQSINGKGVTISERYMARPNQQEIPLRRTNSTQMIDPLGKQLWIKILENDRDQSAIKAATAAASSLSLLDFAENEDDDIENEDNVNIPKKSFKSNTNCLGKEIREQKIDATNANTSLNCHRMLLPVLQNAASASEARLSDLECLEYSSVASSSVGCEWGTACGGLTFPYFPGCRPRLVSSSSVAKGDKEKQTRSHEISTSKNANKTRLHLTFRNANRTRKSNNNNVTKWNEAVYESSSCNAKQSLPSVSQTELVLKDKELTSIRPKTDAPTDNCDKRESLSCEARLDDDDASVSRETEFSPKQGENENDSRLMLAALHQHEKNSYLSKNIVKSFSALSGESYDSQQTSKTHAEYSNPQIHSALPPTAASAATRVSASDSLASPFPMQFRTRVRAPPNISIPFVSVTAPATSLSVLTKFELDDEISDRPSSPSPPPSHSNSPPGSSQGTGDYETGNRRRPEPLAMEKVQSPLDVVTQTIPFQKLSELNTGNRTLITVTSTNNCKPPTFPEKSKRRSMTSSQSHSRRAPHRDRRNPISLRKRRENLKARVASILDEDDEDDSDTYDDEIENA